MAHIVGDGVQKLTIVNHFTNKILNMKTFLDEEKCLTSLWGLKNPNVFHDLSLSQYFQHQLP